jgi:nitrogen regulatory protein PII
MREIKAFIPASRAADMLEALKEAKDGGVGILNLAAFPVQAMFHGRVSRAHYSVELAEEVTPTVKVEMLCEAGEVLRISELIKREVGAGVRGCGWIIVTQTLAVEPIGGVLEK